MARTSRKSLAVAEPEANAVTETTASTSTTPTPPTAELRRVDPRSLRPNPDNPRRVAAPLAQDDQLDASLRAIGLRQPPVVREAGPHLEIVFGHRRVASAIAAACR